jgi:hypothetical protein
MSSRYAPAEAREPELMLARAQASPASSSSTSRPTSCATTSITRSSGSGGFASQHWNPKMKEEGVSSLARYKFQNYVKEIYYDSDTNMALLSGAPFDDPSWWLSVERADRQGARTDQRLRGLAPPAGAHRDHAQAARLDG